MIPVATSNKTNGCNPISSNCVVWQGPDIPCIDLCHGDTISEVIYKLAVELCDLLDATSLTGLDLSCLDLNQTPQTQKELLQVIIDTLCSLDGRCTVLDGWYRWWRYYRYYYGNTASVSSVYQSAK